MITKADGTKLSEHHYYPYGLEVPIEQEDPVPEGFIFEDGFETGDTSRWATPGSPQPPPEGPPPEELSVKYTGHERDLHRSTDYMLARSYAFLLGRFLSVDPVQDGWSRYGYARNNPVSFKDPDGNEAAAATAGFVLVGGGKLTVPPFLAAAGPAAVAVDGGFVGVKVGRALGGFEIAEGLTVDNLVSDFIATEVLGAPDGFPMETGDAFSSMFASVAENFSPHALDQMAERGVPPSAVLGAIATGVKTADAN